MKNEKEKKEVIVLCEMADGTIVPYKVFAMERDNRK